jgi:tRNA 2-selenouridine synthase
LKPLVGSEEFNAWKALLDNQKMPELFERLMANHYDPAYRRSTLRHYPNIDAAQLIRLTSLSQDALREVASMLVADQS